MKSKKYLPIIGVIVFAALLMIVTKIWFGSISATILWLNGEAFYLSPKNVTLEDREPGSEEIVTFHLKNLTRKEISVVGEKSSCSCAFSENIPITAAAKETVELRIRVKLPKYRSDYDQTVLFMVATPEKLEMSPVRITASIPIPLPIPDENGAATENEATIAAGMESESSPPTQDQTDAKETVQ